MNKPCEPPITESLFPSRLKNLLKEKRVSQATLAEYLGLTKQSVSLYVTGKRTPDIETLMGMCDYLDVSSDYLLGRCDLRSADSNDLSIHKRLGLTDSALHNLEIIKDQDEGFALNMLLSSQSFITWLGLAFDHMKHLTILQWIRTHYKITYTKATLLDDLNINLDFDEYNTYKTINLVIDQATSEQFDFLIEQPAIIDGINEFNVRVSAIRKPKDIL